MSDPSWQPVESAPRDGMPFLLGTASGGILLEFWHWHDNHKEPRGCVSQLWLGQLRKQAPREVFLWLRGIPTPKPLPSYAREAR